MRNITEGFSWKVNKEFIQFLRMSKNSAAEVQSPFSVALCRKYV